MSCEPFRGVINLSKSVKYTASTPGWFMCALRLSICAKECMTSYGSCVFVADSTIFISYIQVVFTITFNCYDTIPSIIFPSFFLCLVLHIFVFIFFHDFALRDCTLVFELLKNT